MKVAVGVREFEFGSQDLGELRDCNALLGDRDALHQRIAEDGYLLVRGLHERQTVLAARQTILQYMNSGGEAVPHGTDLMDAHIKPGGKPPPLMGRAPITHHPEVKVVLESPRLFDFYQNYFGEPVLTYDYKWLRAVGTSEFTGAHYDVVYMGRGTQDHLLTCWTPFGDIPLEMGTLAICVGSHRLDSFEPLRKTYGRLDADRDKIGGWYTNDPLEVTQKFGGQWQTTPFRAGDMITFGMFTLHASTNNVTDRWRISCDVRFQPRSKPLDERWSGPSPRGHNA